MSAFVVSNIAADLKMQTNDQRFIFGNNALPEPLASFKIDNIFTPVVGTPSVTNFETRNNTLSGFRWVHTTNSSDTFGSLKLQSFVNAQSTGTDILLFNADGTITFNSSVSFPGFAISGDFNMHNYKITNLADPINAQDAATKAFVESLISGGGTVTLTGAVSGSGGVGTDIVTTLNTVSIDKLAGYPTDSTLFLRGNGTWSNNFAKIGVNIDPTDTGVIQFASGSADVKIVFHKDDPFGSFDVSGIGFYSSIGTLYHTPLGKSHAFFTGANGSLALKINPTLLSLHYGIDSIDYRRIVLHENFSNPNQTYAMGVEFDGTPDNFIHLRNQVGSIGDAFNWCYGINATDSGEWMRLDNSGLNLYNKRIFNVADPVNAQDVATKAYADSVVGQLSNPYSLADNLTFNWSSNSVENPNYEFVHHLTDDRIDKIYRYRVLTNDIHSGREWSIDYTLIGNSDLNGIFEIKYGSSPLSTIIPLKIEVYPFLFGDSRSIITLDGVLSLSNHRILDVASPLVSTDATNKDYVDTRTLNQFAAPDSALNINNQDLNNVKILNINDGLFLPTSGGTPAKLDYYETASYTANWTGPRTVSNTVSVMRIGNFVYITGGEFGLANATATAAWFFGTTLPTKFRPPSNRNFLIIVRNNGQDINGLLQITSGGSIGAYVWNNPNTASFSSGTNTSIYGFCVSYSIV